MSLLISKFVPFLFKIKLKNKEEPTIKINLHVKKAYSLTGLVGSNSIIVAKIDKTMKNIIKL